MDKGSRGLYTTCISVSEDYNYIHVPELNLPGVPEDQNQLQTPNSIDNEIQLKSIKEGMGYEPQETQNA